MNWNYISGFFDADGSVTLCRHHEGKMKTLQVSFHNNEICILQAIRTFIESELHVKGSLTLKKARKENHQDSYDLKYSYRAALSIGNKMNALHPKKVHRFNIYNEIQKLTPRNGKYTPELLQARLELEEQFWKH